MDRLRARFGDDAVVKGLVFDQRTTRSESRACRHGHGLVSLISSDFNSPLIAKSL